MKPLLQISLAFIFILSSCKSSKTITRNYSLSFDEQCDCLTRSPLILVGAKSNYFKKETAFCTNPNYTVRKDSVRTLENLKDDFPSRLEEIDSLIINFKNEWTHLKIKTKWNPSYKGSEIVILKQRVKYYNKFNRGRKFIGMKLIVSDSLVESSLGE